MPPLLASLRRMAEPTPFLPPFFPSSEISSFLRTSAAITLCGTQEVLSTPAGRKYLTGSSVLTSSPSMTLTHPSFYIAPLTVAPTLTFSLLPPLLLFLAPGRCFRTWVLTTYQFFYLFFSLWSFAPTSVLLPSTFKKLAGMTLSPTLTPTVLLQRNTRLFHFPLLLLSLPLWHWVRLNLPLLLAASSTILKPGGLLRWKVRLEKTQGFRCRSQKWWRSPGLHLRFSTRLVIHRQGWGWGMADDLLFSLTQIKSKNCILFSSLYRWLSFLVFLLS